MLKTSVLSSFMRSLHQIITILCKFCYHYLRNICTVQPYLTTSSAKTIMHSVIFAKWDYYNSLFSSTSQIFLSQSYNVYIYAAARIVQNLKKYDSVTPYLMQLHWLPVKQHIIYKLNLIVLQILKDDAPDYIQSLLSIN